ncbi:MAG TPA: MarR family transcriptional regulator [Thermomicrobiales bacterium]|nr:MarR family transcriptional regulator [Thermomicrobiales bacterium]
MTAQVDRQLDAVLRTHGLNRGQLNVLLTIGSDEGLTQQDLADRLGLTKANVSQLLSRLEANGLIRREPVARAYALYLTDTSRDQLITAVEDQEAVIRAHFAGLNVLEQAQLQTLVAKIEHATGDE